ncbi:MAG: GH92 family glycosyl hydrolase [Myxococcales bacterium]|nr:GH92 family glycosyl hydrolase [Myxococcales bacterium]
MRTTIFFGLALALAACGDDDAPATDAGSDASDDASVVDAGMDAGPEPGPSRPATAPYVQWVDPLIGTGGLGFGVGSVSPAPQTPFGLVRPAPDTTQHDGAPGFSHCAGYYYPDPLIMGFSQIRAHGMGIPEYGLIALMPTDGMTNTKTHQDGYRQAYAHENETVEVGLYDVTMDDGIRAEITASDHVAFHRYTFPTETDPTVILDLGHRLDQVQILEAELTIDPDAQEVWGSVLGGGGYARRRGGVRLYFVARFDSPFASHGVFVDGATREGDHVEGTTSGAYFRFDDTHVEVAVALSFTDLDGARANLEAQLAPFDDVRASTVEAWESHLSRVRISARSDEELRVFYSALYRSLLMPTLAMDVDGRYRGLDHEVHQVPLDGEGSPAFRYSTDHSLWDTYRTQVPLLSWLFPELQRDMVLSLVQMGHDGGYVPRWPLGTNYTGGMVGDGAALQVADAAVKGVQGIDYADALERLRVTADGPTPPGAPFGGRAGITGYLSRGWVGIEEAGASASWTLEMAYADFALARLAEHLGEDALRDSYDERAGYWRNLWDADRGFLLGRNVDGSFPESSTNRWEDFYAEGNAWQYLFFVPHDLEGLADVLGDDFFPRLDRFFQESTRNTSTVFPNQWYWHGNEPDIHAPFIYAALDEPEGTWRWGRWVSRTYYDDTPDGLPGNDDAGTLSAWYVFAALGVYPVTVAADWYALGSPLVTYAEVDLPSGGTFVVDARDGSDRAWRVREARWNDAPLSRSRIGHAELAAGGTLTFDMEE